MPCTEHVDPRGNGRGAGEVHRRVWIIALWGVDYAPGIIANLGGHVFSLKGAASSPRNESQAP